MKKSAPTAPPAPVFKAGFAERDITPDIGMEAPGGYGKSYHRSFHDACKARAAVFDDGKQRVALVGLDLLFITRALTKEVRADIQQRCGIKAENILLGASHSHSSGPIGMAEPGDYDQAPPFVQDLYFKNSTISNPGFTQLLRKQIVDAVVAANDARADAKLAVGFGHEDQVSFNRRLHMKGGLSFSHPGAGNPDILDYAGPIDPQVGVVGVWDLKSNLLGVVVNFSCHATTSPGGISANWPSAMEQTLRGATGNAALPVVFMQGACGDVTQVDNLTKFTNPGAEEWWQLVGGRVGAEAFKTLLLIRRGANSDIPVDARQKIWMVKRRLPTPEKVKQATALVQQDPKVVGTTEWTFAKEIVMLDAVAKVRPEVEVEVQAIQVGPAVFVSDPAEYFVQYGLDIKMGSHFPFTFPVELANGCTGYVPTEEALGPNGGGYETRLTSYSNLEVSAGRQFANTGIALANQMTPGKIPQPPPAPPFRAAWAYGNLPAELK
ncbi:MAG: neutral/alkaline non-lysosomal ceramidase N-terminal domain-containing protein [Verrucomicrobia bacterium]|nr:neutral/alkaline non-lysosomal ceramidase N-terminal domain-containing protein [Verrucomicrobiota bacterium]